MLMPMERLFKKNKLYSFIHLMGFIFLLPLQGSATPEIAVDEVIHHYGVLYAEDQPAVSHQFIVSNKGNEPLVINDIQSSCGCTKAEISRSEIPPGETAVLDTTLSPREKQGREQIRISLYSNDPDHQVFEVGLSGYIIPRWSIQEVRGIPNVITTGSSNEAIIRVSSYVKSGDDKRFILDATSEHPLVHAILLDETKETQLDGYVKADQEIRIVVDGGKNASHQEKAQVHIRNSDPQKPELQYEASWIVENDLHLSRRGVHVINPKYFSWKNRTTLDRDIEEKIRGRIYLQSESSTAFRILSATATPPFVVEIQNDTPMSASEFIVSISGERTGKYQGELRIRTDRPDEDIFLIKLTGVIQPQEPILSSDSKNRNFGILFPDQASKLTNSFKLENLGLKPLLLSTIEVKGVTAALTAETIPPGQSARYELTADLNGQKGEFDRYAILRNNDPTQPTITFHLTGRILPYWDIVPDKIRFRSLQVNEEISSLVTVRQYFPSWAKPETMLTGKSADGSIMFEPLSQKCVYQPIGYGSAETEVKITLKNNRSGGYWEVPVELAGTESHLNQKSVAVTVEWDVLGDLRSRPTTPIIKIMQDSTQNFQPATLKIYSKSGKPFEVRSVECPDSIKMNAVDRKPSEIQYEIWGVKPEEKAGRILFHTDRQDEPCIAVDCLIEKQ